MADNLPVEVVTHIMRFLSVSDRKEAGLVCRLWYEASIDPILLKDTIVTFHAPEVTQKTVAGLGKRKSLHLVLDQIDASTNSVICESSRIFSSNIQSLSLKGTTMTESAFIALLSNCSSLRSLDLSCCNSLFMSGRLLEFNADMQKLKGVLHNVVHLNLTSIRYLSDAVFNRIITVCTNIEKLSVAGCRLTFHTGAYYSGSSSSHCANATMLTFNNLLSFIQGQCKLLKSLNVSRTGITNEALLKVAQTEDLHLQELELMGCKELSDEGIINLCRKQKSLQSLNLSLCMDISDSGVCAIQGNLKKLKNLNLYKCRQVTDGSIKKLYDLPQLENLCLSDCYQITSQGLIKGLCCGILTKMTHLNLSSCNYVNDTFVTEMCRALKDLVHLDLGSCYGVTDIGVQAISRNLKYLQVLKLGWCKDITDLGLIGLQRSEVKGVIHVHDDDHGTCRCTRKHQKSNIFNKPEKLETKPFLSVEEAVSALEKKDLCSIDNLAGLRLLTLTACAYLTDASLSQVLRFKELKELNLSMCTRITDATLVALATNTPSIEELSISQCRHITDEGLISAVSKLPRLTGIDVSSCDGLTDKSMEVIKQKCKRLKSLDVSLCSGVSLQAVEQLESQLPYLKSVKKRLVGGSTDAF